MRILKPLQTSVLEKPFTYTDRHFLCVSLLWGFRLSDGSPVLETEIWGALTGLLEEGRIFDQCMPKDRAEFLCAGSFHAYGGDPVRQDAVSVRVGNVEKRLLVSGPRFWRAGVASRPEPITTQPIRYSEAFGGEGFPENPGGKGYAPDADDDRRPLPCVEYPRAAVTSPSQTPQPASFEGRDMQWPSRQRYAGTYDEAYMRKRMPGLPDDIDWRVFNDGAEDQWFQGFLHGDEDFELVKMHPGHARLKGHLPGVIGRAFIERKVHPEERDSELEFREVPLKLDTLWLLPDHEIGVVIHRGTTEIAEDDATDVVNLLAAHENIDQQRRPREHYREEMRRRGDPENGYRYMLDTRPLLPVGCNCAIQDLMAADPSGREGLVARNLVAYTDNQRGEAGRIIDERGEALREQMNAHEGELPAEAVDLDRNLEDAKKAFGDTPAQSGEKTELQGIIEKIAPGAGTEAGVDLAAVDFDAFDELQEYARNTAAEQEAEFERTLRERVAELRRLNEPESAEMNQAIAAAEQALANLKETAAPLPRPSGDADISRIREQLDALEQYREELLAGGVDVEQIRSAIPDLDPIREKLEETERAVADQYRVWAHFLGPSLSPHPGEEAERRARLLAMKGAGDRTSDLDFAFVDLAGATLRDLDLSRSYLEYVDFSGATLIDVDLTGAVLAKSRLQDCRFERVTLKDANLGAAEIQNAAFVGCDMTEVRLGLSHIVDSRFERCALADGIDMFMDTRFERVIFEACTMRDAVFLKHDLGQCGFRESDLTGCNFLQGDLTRADFGGATLSGVNVVSTPAPGACFDDAIMENTRFIDQPVLNDCTFRGASLSGTNFREADLTGSDFSGANVSGADFDQADLTNTRFERVRAIGTQFRKVNLDGATLEGSDLREASLMKARMTRTVFRNANLYSVSFLFVTLGETEFGGANMDNTILRDWRPRGG